jgi:hypothetical protein
MATQIIANGSTAAESSATTLADGASVIYAMRGRGHGVVQIQTTTGWEDMKDKEIGIGTPVLVSGPGTYRVRRPAQANECAFEVA